MRSRDRSEKISISVTRGCADSRELTDMHKSVKASGRIRPKSVRSEIGTGAVDGLCTFMRRLPSSSRAAETSSSLRSFGIKEIARDFNIEVGRSLDRKSRVECGGTSQASTTCNFMQELEES